MDRPITNGNGSGLNPRDFYGATPNTQAIETSKGSTSTIPDGIFSSTKDAINSSDALKTDTTNEVTGETKNSNNRGQQNKKCIFRKYVFCTRISNSKWTSKIRPNIK